MGKTYKDSPQAKQSRDRAGRGRKRYISIRSVRRDPPDYRKLSQAVIALAVAEADAQAVPARADRPADGAADDR